MLKGLIEGMVALVMSSESEGPELEDRRQRVRLRCHYPVRVEGTKEPFRSVVTDVGPRGLQLKFVPALRAGTELVLHYGEAGALAPVRCKAVWCRKRRHSPDRLAGAEFVGDLKEISTTWVGEVLKELGFNSEGEVNPRRWVRADTYLPAQLTIADNERMFRNVEGKIVNLSLGGASLLAPKVAAGAPVSVEAGPWRGLSELRLSGTVLSCEDDELLEESLVRVRFEHARADQEDLLGKYILQMLREKHL